MSIPVHVDVTNTLASPSVTGIQRFVRETLSHWPVGSDLRVVPVARMPRGHRRAAPAELEALAAPPPALATNRLARSLRRRHAAARRRWRELRAGEPHDVVDRSSVWLELEAAWWNDPPRSELLPMLRGAGVPVVAMVYDVLPLTDPQWFPPESRERFERWFAAVRDNATGLLTISRFSAEAIEARTGRAATVVIPGTGPPPASARRAPRWWPVGDAGVIAAVGTVEPRKNLGQLVTACRRLADEDAVHLVVAGRAGWEDDEVIRQLRSGRAGAARITWVEDASDREIDWLYRHADVVAVPSRLEGYGLPVAEALARGAAVVAADAGAVPEAARGAAVLVSPDDADGWVDALGRMLRDDAARVAQREAAAQLPARSWAEVAAEVAAAVRTHVDGARS